MRVRTIEVPTTVEAQKRADRWQRLTAWGAIGLAVATALTATVSAGATRVSLQAARQQYALGLAQQELAERGQVTDRFTKANDQLASDQLASRLGGIYALGKIMRDAPDYGRAVMEVLSAFIRTNATKDRVPEKSLPATDVQAALAVLTSRPDINPETIVDLRGVYLAGVDLAGRNMSGFDLSEAILNCVEEICANLAGTDLSGARLRRTDLWGADLSHANLTGADLHEANLTGVTLPSN